MEIRTLPEVPSSHATNTLLDRLRLIVPSSNSARSSIADNGLYAEICGDVAGTDGGGGGRTIWRASAVDDPYHYIDIDRLADRSGSGDQIVSPHGYEGLDQAVLPTFRQPQRPNNYDRLAAQEAADAGAATEVIEMTALDPHDEIPEVVSNKFQFHRIPVSWFSRKVSKQTASNPL